MNISTYLRSMTLMTFSVAAYVSDPALENIDISSPAQVKYAICKSLILPGLFNYGLPIDSPIEQILTLTHADLSARPFHQALIKQMDYGYQAIEQSGNTGFKNGMLMLLCAYPLESREALDRSLTLGDIIDLSYEEATRLAVALPRIDPGAIFCAASLYSVILCNQWLYRDLSESQIKAIFAHNEKVFVAAFPHLQRAVFNLMPLFPAINQAVNEPAHDLFMAIADVVEECGATRAFSPDACEEYVVEECYSEECYSEECCSEECLAAKCCSQLSCSPSAS